MSSRKRFELETLGEGNKCHILRVGSDHVVFTEGERAELISILQAASNVTPLDSRRVNGKTSRKTPAAVGRRR